MTGSAVHDVIATPAIGVALAIVAAVLLDRCLGEPRRAHPLVAFGTWATWIERRSHADRRVAGVLAWACAVPPLVALSLLLTRAAEAVSAWLAVAWSAYGLYLCIGLRSLGEHALPVADALERDDLPVARDKVGWMVSRDTDALDGAQVATAATESVLENGCDAVFGALFWFVLLGVPGAVLYRLANTLDAMWGYRTQRYLRFGWAAARIDDLLNLVPARLTAATYAMCGATGTALRCWRTQGLRWKSPNAGPVMAAGAGALQLRLGGPAPYHGQWTDRPALGEGRAADAGAIRAAIRLVRAGVGVWIAMVCVFALAAWWWEVAHA